MGFRVRWQHTFPHSSQRCTRWPLAALLTRPVRVYLIALPPSGGVDDRCILFSREEPRCWGLRLTGGPDVAVGGALLGSACSVLGLAERPERRRLLVGVLAVCPGCVEDPCSEGGASDCMLGGTR